ncbi:MAG: energy-coupling factor ABC transporter ATP-binding protein [Candidatus Bathyarchaeum sp.]|nr:MAG: energy-coupling factor ABC transporter ATP-binding protein [Candidatus Bathyarchaeum sp.]
MSFKIENLSHRYEDGTIALNEVSTCFDKGKRTALLGTNGSGKTTLLLHLNGILQPTSGKIYFENEPLNYKADALRSLRKRVGYVFQDPNDQLFAPTVKQDVSFGPLNLGLPVDEVKASVDEALEIVGMSRFVDKPPHFLSLGQKKRVALAGVLAMHPEVIVMDEPTSNLDPIASSELLHLLLKLNKESGITLIMATHDVDMVPLYANKLCILSESKIVVEGSPNKIFSDSDLIRKVNLRSPRITHLFEILKKEDKLPINKELPLTISQARKQIIDILTSKTKKDSNRS